ncbi:MAG TPA: hypothetical protein VLI07_09865 [Candidatus Binatus sp.]|jgi:hypothetical protein|nr:hypothetical protein [Candidatus Binatus sp.]
MRLLTTLVSFLAVPAWGAPTGLIIIPTTDLVPPRQLSLALQNGNTELRGSDSMFHEPRPNPQSELGLPWNVEGGLDLVPADGPEDYRPQLNLKWKVLPEGYHWPAVAVGASQVGPGFAPNYFLVLSRTLNYQQVQYQKFRAHHRNIKLRGIRLHTGILYTGYAWRALLGTDIEVSDHFVFYADWMSGRSNALSLGGAIIINREDSLVLAVQRGNDQDRISGLVLQFTHTFSW